MSACKLPQFITEIQHWTIKCGGLLLITTLYFCNPPEETFDPDYQGGLVFSQDTVIFDTVFTSRGSITKRFKVQNPHENAITIQSMRLGKGQNSPYTIIANGEEGRSFDNFKLLGEDSALILVKVTIDPRDENLPFLVKDSIIFETGNQEQNVKLISWGQDANFLGDSVLECNAQWNNDRPYVLFKSILVDSLCSLTINKGTRIYVSKGASIFVKGTLKVNGSDSLRVIIRNDRLDLKYENAIGQWGGIFFLEGSKANEIKYAVIRNGQVGLRVGTPDNDTIPDVIIKNTIIENMSQSGILAFTSDIQAENCLVDNCQEIIVGNIAGGNYQYKHCTFANYRFNIGGDGPAVAVTDNFELDNGELLVNNVNFSMQNCIVYGANDDEIFLSNDGNARLEIFIAGSLLKTTIEDLDINMNILNEKPDFKNSFNFDYHLDSLSPAIDKGLDLKIPIDLDSSKRDEKPDIGAYEYLTK